MQSDTYTALVHRCPYFDVIVQAGCSDKRKMWMVFQAIDNAQCIASEPFHNARCRLMPHENVTAITTAHHVFRLRAKEIDPFDGFTISTIRMKSA